MNQITGSVVTVLLGIIGVATLAILVSKQANTAGVIQAGSSGFSSMLGTAISPITGQSVNSLGTMYTGM